MPTVLLVADTPWVINQVKASLSLADWEMVELSDPRQTIPVTKETAPDVVLVDMQVGSMGGMAVIRAIRQEFEPPARPRTILLLDRSADAFIARRAGADAHVLKPIEASALRAALSPAPLVTVGAEEE